MKKIVSNLREKPLWPFFILSILISWILWIPLLYGHFKLGWTSWEGNSWNNYRTMLGILGSLGPAISAIIVTYLIQGKNGIKILLKRVIQWKVKFIWWMVALYLWWLLCTLIAAIFELSSLQNISLGFVFSIINIPAMIFIVQFPLLIGMFGEELGWRGFALPKLLEKYNPVVASLILALPWILWHIPLSVFQEWRGNISIFYFLIHYILLIIPLTLIFTWFFQKTRGSILLVMILHKSFNLTFNAYSIAIGLDQKGTEIIRDYSILILWLLAAILGIYYIYHGKSKQSKETDKSNSCKHYVSSIEGEIQK